MVLDNIIKEDYPPPAVGMSVVNNLQRRYPDAELPHAIDMPGVFMIVLRDPYIVQVTRVRDMITGKGNENVIMMIGIIESPSYKIQYRKILEKTAVDIFGENYVTKYKRHNKTGKTKNAFYTFKLYVTLEMYPRINEFFEKLNVKIDTLVELPGGEEEYTDVTPDKLNGKFSNPINEEMLK